MTHHVPAELQNYVRQSIIPQYTNFDKAHQIDHVEKVIEESLKLATHYEVDYSMFMSSLLIMTWGCMKDVNFII